jgi:hypothetical protein
VGGWSTANVVIALAKLYPSLGQAEQFSGKL